MIRNVFQLTGIILLAVAACADPSTDTLREEPRVEAAEDGNMGEPRRPGTFSSTVATVCEPGANGGWHHCSAACPCAASEGDCDSNDECAPGLSCVKNIGATYGWDPDVDVCEDTCHPSANGGFHYCNASCPCAAGEGDCDSNSECMPGLTCVKNVGPRYGWDSDVDVCEGQCDDAGDTCLPGCPCAPAGTSLFLQVLALDGQPIPSAAVSMGDVPQPTDGVGRILLEDLAPGRVVARVEAHGFASASVAVDLPADAHAGAEVRLRPLGAPIPFQAEAGAVIERPAARVTIPPGALVDHLGQPVTGTVEATVVPLDPAQATLDSLPGPLQGRAAGTGATVELESLVMVEVSVWQNGLPVQLAPGARATLELPLPDAVSGQYQIGESIPAWWLDLDAGVWREEGAGTIQPSASDPGQLLWVVEVGHFTWWNSDRPWTDKHCFTVTVQDASGNPVPDVRVSAAGVSYISVSTSSYTGGSGQACVEIMRDGTADILVGSPATPLATQRVTGAGPAADCAGSGGACTPMTVTLPFSRVICTPGASAPCPYGGPPGTEGVGMCQAGRNQCNADGTAWSGCVGEVQPQAETCTNPFDEDCDGEVDDGLDCSGCSIGQRIDCYSGPPATLGVGICRAGAQTCSFTRVFGPCVGEVVPQVERCATPGDDDCDGTAMFSVWEGDFYAADAAQLEQLRGCSGVRGALDLEIWAEHAASLSALDSIQFIDGSLFIYVLEAPMTPAVFPSLVTVGGDLNLENNRTPGVFDAFPSLVSVGGTLYLYDIEAEVVTGLPRLRTVGGQMMLDSIRAPSVDVLAPNLETIGGWLGFLHVHVSSMSGFPALQSARGIFLWETTAESIQAFDTLPSIDIIEIDRCEIGQLQGLDSLVSVGGIAIGRSIVWLEGAFPALRSMRGSFQADRSSLHVVESFQALESIGGGLRIEGDDGSGELVDSFDLLSSVSGNVEIQGSSLSRVRGFRSLVQVDQLVLDDNAGLTSLEGFDRLAEAEGGIRITNNPALDACYAENLEALVRSNGYAGSFEAHDNGSDGGACAALPGAAGAEPLSRR